MLRPVPDKVLLLCAAVCLLLAGKKKCLRKPLHCHGSCEPEISHVFSGGLVQTCANVLSAGEAWVCTPKPCKQNHNRQRHAQAAREEEAANRASMPGRDAFEELKRMAAATISATPPGLRGGAPSGNGTEQEAGTSGNGRHLLLALGIWRVGCQKRTQTMLQISYLLPPCCKGCTLLCSPVNRMARHLLWHPSWRVLLTAQMPFMLLSRRDYVMVVEMPGYSGISMVHECHPCGGQ